jgi:DNA helicase-2/ATP-dependent DNA helicase PcrA
MKNKLIIAGAGSGKTTYIINHALKFKDKRILITTFTQANLEEIKRRFMRKCGCIPANITVQTWFSFLLQHGVRPYQGCKYDGVVTGLFLVPGQSAVGIPEKEVGRHYFTSDKKIYSDKIAKFALDCNKLTDGLVAKRLNAIFDSIFVDEVQDIAGYDLDLLKLLIDSDINILLVGDPRQGTYATNNSAKNRQYRRAQTVDFFNDKTVNIETDDTTLGINYRCHSEICNVSNKLYTNFAPVACGSMYSDHHQGLYIIKPADVSDYLLAYEPMQLINDIRNKHVDRYRPFLNFGVSKGMEFDRILIYPTEPIRNWFLNQEVDSLAPVSKAKLYVALTRARKSAAIVSSSAIAGVPFWDKASEN